MSAVTYHGQFPDGQERDGDPYIEQYGYTFVGNKSVNVTDEVHLRKFAGNRFFKVAGKSDKDAVEQGQDEAEKAEAESLREWLNEHQVPFHHKLGLEKLRDLKEAYLKAQDKAQDA